jgi:hypothetical protein
LEADAATGHAVNLAAVRVEATMNRAGERGMREKPRTYRPGPRYPCFFVTVNFRRAHSPDSVSRVAIEFASRTWDN